MEVKGNWRNHQNTLVLKCKVRVAVRSGNVANKQDHADKDSDICQPLPEKNSANTLDGQGEQ